MKTDPRLFSALDITEVQRTVAALDAAPDGTAQIAALRSLAGVVFRLALRIGLDLETITIWRQR